MSAETGDVAPFVAKDGFELYARVWKPAGQTKAKLVHLHGFSDHSGRYVRMFPTLADAGIEVHVLDQRGWGRSVKQPSDVGNTGGTVQVMSDITDKLRSLLPSPVPVFLSGHSMGGGESLYYAANGPADILEQLSGVLAIAPWITLDPATQPWKTTVFFGRLLSKIMPHFKLVQKLDPSFLSHDDVANQTWVNDPLCHNTATLQTYDGSLTRADELNTGKALPHQSIKRIWIGHGEEDHITNPQGSKDYHARTKQIATLKLYPKTRHCIHIEPDTREEFFNDLISFILTAAKASEPQSKL